jgi:hypothetical protein
VWSEFGLVWRLPPRAKLTRWARRIRWRAKRKRLRHRTAGGGVVLGVALGLSLIAVGIARHPVSIQGAGRGLLLTDIGLLLAYGIVGIRVWYQRRADVGIALRVGMLAGLVLGTVHVVNQVIEASVPIRHFAFIISPVLLRLALFGAAGSAWECTRSFTLAVIAGVWCAMVATLILLCFAFSFNLAFVGCAGRHEICVVESAELSTLVPLESRRNGGKSRDADCGGGRWRGVGTAVAAG